MRFVVLMAASGLFGCSGPLPWLHGELTNHPPALVGQWVDVAKSSPGDTSLWVLEPDGYDGGVRLVRDSLGTTLHTATRKYGYWYVRAAGAAQEFCVNQRPGRDAPSCTPFEIVTDSSVVPPRRILHLAAYRGQHHTAGRVLVDRR